MKKKIVSLIIAYVLVSPFVYAIAPAAVSAAAGTNQLDYRKQTTLTKDGKTSSIQESWYDPKTDDVRNDYFIPDSKEEYANTSNYSLNNGTKSVTIYRDNKNQAVRGTYSIESAKAAKAVIESNQSFSIAFIKAEYKKPEWKKAGTVKDKKGKVLVKLSKKTSGKIMGKVKGKGVDLLEYAYIDKKTGLPVKTELFTLENGKKALQNTTLLEYDYIDYKESIFDISGVNLKKQTEISDGTDGLG